MSPSTKMRRERIASGLCRDCGAVRDRDGSKCLACAEAERLRMAKRTPGYRCWINMLTRCRNPRATRYARYGGRGIKVCERWLVFANFIGDMGEPPAGLTLDRLDNDGNYEPGNCCWKSKTHQANNRSSNRVLELDGRRMTLAEWSREIGVSQGTLYMRLRRGSDLRSALSVGGGR